jgi:hypothetical protein
MWLGDVKVLAKEEKHFRQSAEILQKELFNRKNNLA